MFERTPEGIYASSLLRLPWLEHGFATRHLSDWPSPYTGVRQIHSSEVVNSDAILASLPEVPQADAIVTGEPGRWIGIRTADCVPILIADPVNHAVSAVHAGWRGTAGGIAAVAVRRMSEDFGSRAEDLLVAIGPCIGLCCFEVGPEVREKFEFAFPESTSFTHIDLSEANRRQLLTSGVEAGHIDTAGLCTRCDPEEFHSWRRDREASGRMVSAVRIRET